MPAHPATPGRRLPVGEAGFSVVEIIIAMFLLALMAVGALPLMMTAISASGTNQQMVKATGLANSQLADMRQRLGTAPTSTCTQIADAATALTTTKDGLRATVTTASCPEALARPETVTVTVKVTPENRTAPVLAKLSTEILVS